SICKSLLLPKRVCSKLDPEWYRPSRFLVSETAWSAVLPCPRKDPAMRLKLSLAAILFAGLASPAGDPAGFMFWKSPELKMQSKTLRPKMNEMKVATQALGGHGNYSFLLAHREGSGEAELHEKQADIFFVQTGEATLVYGGEMENAKTTTANEM